MPVANPTPNESGMLRQSISDNKEAHRDVYLIHLISTKIIVKYKVREKQKRKEGKKEKIFKGLSKSQDFFFPSFFNDPI